MSVVFGNAGNCCPRCKGRIGLSGDGGCYCVQPEVVAPVISVDQDGHVRVTVTSDGTDGEGWRCRLRANGCGVTYSAEKLLRSIDFEPTTGTKYDVVVLRASGFALKQWTFAMACEKSERMGLGRPNAEVACLMRERFSDNDVRDAGLAAIIVAHLPIADASGSFGLLGIDRYFRRCLSADRRYGNAIQGHDVAFAFVA